MEVYGTENNPKLYPTFCAFVDILGFQEIYKQAEIELKTDQLLKEMQAVLSKRTHILRGQKGPVSSRRWTFKIFTDNIVFAFPHLDSCADGEENFADSISRLAEHQLQMALSGFFVRGGLTYGELHISRDIVFGRALIDAYSTETKLAVNPRIVIHKTAVQKLRELLKLQINSAYDSEILVDQDGNYFLNYLSLLVEEDWFDSAKLELHKNKILSCLDRYRTDQKVLEKYLWLSTYHNYFCNQFVRPVSSSSGLDLDRLLIPNASIPAMSFLSATLGASELD